jgi:hypothetical protein
MFYRGFGHGNRLSTAGRGFIHDSYVKGVGPAITSIFVKIISVETNLRQSIGTNLLNTPYTQMSV